MKFNEKLIKLRKAAGFSQEELGNRLNIIPNDKYYFLHKAVFSHFDIL